MFGRRRYAGMYDPWSWDPFDEMNTIMRDVFTPTDLFDSSMLGLPAPSERFGEKGVPISGEKQLAQREGAGASGAIAPYRDWGFGDRWVNWIPKTDVTETSNAMVLRMELPGLKREDLNIEVVGEGKNKTLVVSGQNSRERSQEGENWIRTERSYGNFTRSFRLPEHINTDNIKANLDVGVLTLNLPKIETAKERKTHKIAIEDVTKSKQEGAH